MTEEKLISLISFAAGLVIGYCLGLFTKDITALEIKPGMKVTNGYCVGYVTEVNDSPWSKGTSARLNDVTCTDKSKSYRLNLNFMNIQSIDTLKEVTE